MTLKNLLYFLLVIFLSGCTQAYNTTSSEHFDALDKRITLLEQNISQKLEKNDEDYKRLIESSLIQQSENYASSINELTTLVKSKKPAKVKQQPIIIQKKTTTSLKEKLIVGSVEKVHIYPSNIIMDARIDTGAETSSIDAREITRFERDGKKWVRFTLVDRKTNIPYVMERKVIRVVRISQSSLEKEYEKRVVVVLKITIGDKKELSEFTLTDREHMQFPMLIGRNALQDVIVVDVSGEYLAPLTIEKTKK
ncbi:MAG: ATP-dependent zinc protease [Sulfurimonas sp.]|uniref:ATP-dependent zinc protease family protein n=1 Tax=Sulfurimonas sp. TaxID=2022749 RepID=UPI0025D7D75F|nr:ATP-dependent zinc protease [Sulfurimonas sp.]MCK9492128.1 ATP-dependent zinc protease [Sulfurimonas sp.]